MKLNNLEEKYFKEITQIIAPSGREEELSLYLENEFKNLGLEVIKDNLGSTIGYKKSKLKNAKKVLILAHMDEVGFMVSNILENGMLKVLGLGGFDYNSLPSNRVIVLNDKKEKIHGVINSIPPHLLKNRDAINENDILIDLGFSSKDSVINAGIHIGTPLVCDGPFFISRSEESIISKALDNRFGIVLGLDIVNELLNEDLPYDLYVGGSVQEEVGSRGASTIVEKIHPDFVIVVDCSPARDFVGGNDLGKLGEGVLIRYFDVGMIAKKCLLDMQIEACNRANVKYQYYNSPGRTDAAVTHKMFDGIPTLTHCICARSIHTPSSIIRISDYLAAKNSLLEILKMLDENKFEEIKGF